MSNQIARALNASESGNSETKEEKRAAFAASKRLTMNKSMVAEEYQEEIKWMRLKGVELTTADGLPPLPMHLSWVRSGILVVGMDNEMQVYALVVMTSSMVLTRLPLFLFILCVCFLLFFFLEYREIVLNIEFMRETSN